MTSQTLSLPAPSTLSHHWDLDSQTVYLNHGGFGVTPRAVGEHQAALRARIDANPTRFYVDDLPGLMDEARHGASRFLSCAWDQVAFVPNATTGVATVMHNLRASPGDEIIVNDHEYPACLNIVRAWAGRTGARVVMVTLPFPVREHAEITRAITSAVTPQTRWCLLSAITSPSGMMLPHTEIVSKLRARGVETILDAAHAPGQIAFDIDAIGAAYTTGNFHKWVNAPKSVAFVHVRKDVLEGHDRTGGFRPVVLSNNAEKPKPNRAQFLTEFDYVGTSDPTSALCVPTAIECMRSMHCDGWNGIYAHNHGCATRARDHIIETLAPEFDITPGAPKSMLGSMASMVLPLHPLQRTLLETPRKSAHSDKDLTSHISVEPTPTDTAWKTRYLDPIWDRLVDVHRVQVPVFQTRAGRTLRISAQLYNSMDQYAYLARTLKSELARERNSCD